MGLFHKHDGRIAAAFNKVMEHGERVSESEFLDSLNLIINAIEKDDSYSTNEKLSIYELMQQLSNCAPKDRHKYAKKIFKKLS